MDTVLSVKNASLNYRTRRSFFRHDSHWALSNLTFNVQRGETLGVIGGNGSGKSSLLKLLAGVYTPSKGVIESQCHHRMLLTLQLGFEPALSGRDNALLSGVLLGARRSFVEEKLDEIIAFAELEASIDAPLKTYSSGMRARLGFSVAMVVEADLVLIDEVLGVGDIKFQEKARRAMQARIRSQQTVVYVSHSAETVRELCSRIIWLQHGAIKAIGDPDEVLQRYTEAQQRVPADSTDGNSK